MDPSQDDTSGSSHPSKAVEERDFASDPEPPPQDTETQVHRPTPVHLASGVSANIDTNIPLAGNITQPVQTPGAQSAWNVQSSSDRPHIHGNRADSGDRVFPIRSVISVDPANRNPGEQEYFSRMSSDNYGLHRPAGARNDTQNPKRRTGSVNSDSMHSVGSSVFSGSKETRQEAAKHHPTRQHTSGARSAVQADADRHGSRPLSIFAVEESDDAASEAPSDMGYSQSVGTSARGAQSPLPDNAVDGLMTSRFKHVTDSDGHLVITGRDGTLQRCEDEPIHTPGAVQAFGLLLSLREEPDGSLTVRHASENSKRIIGYSPLELFRLPNFTDILTDEQADNLLDHIDFIRDEDADPAINGPEVFSMSVRQQKRRSLKLWCAIHIHPAHPELVICEFELDDDPEFPLRPEDEHTPEDPEDTLRSNPTMEELAESTEITSRPLRVLRSARKRKGEAGAMQVFDIMSQVQEQLATAPNLERFLKILVGIVKELTGFHRVMVYQVRRLRELIKSAKGLTRNLVRCGLQRKGCH